MSAVMARRPERVGDWMKGIPEGLAGQEAYDAYLTMLIDQVWHVGDGGA